MDKTPIRVLVVDDNDRVRFIVRETLKIEPDIRVCAEAASLAEAYKMLEEHRPDVAILDLSLEDADGGLKLLREMSTAGVSTDFIVLSSHQPSLYSEKSLAFGAKAYVCKDKMVQHLAQAIRCVRAGQRFAAADV